MYGHILLLTALATLVAASPINDVSPGEHIQHVTMPPAYSTPDSNSRIQRVPARQTSQSEPRMKSDFTPQATESSSEASTSPWEKSSVLSTTSEDQITTEVISIVEEDVEELPQPQDDSKLPADDLVTANFFWGLGPVYPHLYQFKRVPHLVPIHSWNPYHDYYVYHQKYPSVYKL